MRPVQELLAREHAVEPKLHAVLDAAASWAENSIDGAKAYHVGAILMAELWDRWHFSQGLTCDTWDKHIIETLDGIAAAARTRASTTPSTRRNSRCARSPSQR